MVKLNARPIITEPGKPWQAAGGQGQDYVWYPRNPYFLRQLLGKNRRTGEQRASWTDQDATRTPRFVEELSIYGIEVVFIDLECVVFRREFREAQKDFLRRLPEAVALYLREVYKVKLYDVE